MIYIHSMQKLPILSLLLGPRNPLFRGLNTKFGYGYSPASCWVRKSSVGKIGKRFRSKMVAWEKYIRSCTYEEFYLLGYTAM
jgi:hypothetical protein